MVIRYTGTPVCPVTAPHGNSGSDRRYVRTNPSVLAKIKQVVSASGDQVGSDDCGVFALAFAVSLLSGFDPVNVVYDQEEMRPHLIKCLDAGHFVPFPTECQCTVRGKVVRTVPFQLYCVCRMSYVKSDPMILCRKCKQWWHKACGEVSDASFYLYVADKLRQYICLQCLSKGQF